MMENGLESGLGLELGLKVYTIRVMPIPAKIMYFSV